MDNNDYKGYTLFNDIEDTALRNRNRAVIMSNIAEFNTKKNRITAKGAALLVGYFTKIPAADRATVSTLFEASMKERGYATTANQK